MARSKTETKPSTADRLRGALEAGAPAEGRFQRCKVCSNATAAEVVDTFLDMRQAQDRLNRGEDVPEGTPRTARSIHSLDTVLWSEFGIRVTSNTLRKHARHCLLRDPATGAPLSEGR